MLLKQPLEKKNETLRRPIFWGQKVMILKNKILIILGTFLTNIQKFSGHQQTHDMLKFHHPYFKILGPILLFYVATSSKS